MDTDPSQYAAAAQAALDKYGVKASVMRPIFERELLVDLRNRYKELEKRDVEERQKLSKLISKAEKDYLLVFHDWIAQRYPYLLFEANEDKVYWIYDEREGIYSEVAMNQARSLVLRELRLEGMIDYMTESNARNILARYRADHHQRGKRYEDFDNGDEWLHVNNGWLHLETKRFNEHDPRRLSRRKSAVNYDPKAVCPKYDSFLDEQARLQKDEVRVIDQFSGVLLTHNVSHQKMLTLIGRPGSGKSTLLEVWSHVLGDLVIQASLTDLSSDKYRFMGSSLAGRTLCWFDEVEVKRAEMGSVLERKITAKQIEIERKGIDGTRVAPNYLKFVLTANTLPMSAEQGIYRRMIQIRFDRSFTTEGVADIRFFDHLKEESSGILNRMLRGLDDIKKMGTFTMIAGHEDKMEEYKTKSSTIAEFLDTHFEPVIDGQEAFEEKISNVDLSTAYNHWVGKAGMMFTPKKFSLLLESQPLNKFASLTNKWPDGKRLRSNSGAYWSGIRLKNNDYRWEDNEFRGRIIVPLNDEKTIDKAF